MRTIALFALLLAACESMSTSPPPPFADPPICNSSPIASYQSCSDDPTATATSSAMFGAGCFRCKDAVGHDIGYVAQPGDPAGTQDLSCWGDETKVAICVGVCVPATQDHRGCPP